jgi:hypothetical protein
MTESRFDRYRQLTSQLGGQPGRALLDKLQVLALTQPDTLREIEAFLERRLISAQRFAAQETNRRQD